MQNGQCQGYKKKNCLTSTKLDAFLASEAVWEIVHPVLVGPFCAFLTYRLHSIGTFLY